MPSPIRVAKALRQTQPAIAYLRKASIFADLSNRDPGSLINNSINCVITEHSPAGSLLSPKFRNAAVNSWPDICFAGISQVNFFSTSSCHHPRLTKMTSYSNHLFQSLTEKEDVTASMAKYGWLKAKDKDAIQKQYKFRDFVSAFSFMTALALECEKVDHHPEWSNCYNELNVLLMSHFCNGVSWLDIKLARKFDEIYNRSYSKADLQQGSSN